MASYVDWEEIAPKKKPGGSNGGGQNNGKFLRLEANQTYTVRMVLKAIKYYKYYNKVNGNLRSAITEDNEKCTVRPRHSELKKAQERRGFIVFNRDENNKCQIMDLPATACDAFKHYKKLTGIDAGSNQSGDFKITVVCPNGIKDRDTTYEIEFVKAVPFTDEEKAFVREHIKTDYNLEEIFKADTPEEIERKLFGPEVPRENKQGNAQGNAQKQAPKQAPKANVEDDGMGDVAPEAPSTGAGKTSTKSEEEDPFGF